MTMNQKPTGTTMSMPAGLAIGGIFSLIITLIMSAIVAKLIEGEVIAQRNVGYFVIGILLISTIVGALISFGRIKRRRMIVCLISGLIYYCILLSITALCFGGQYQGVAVTGLVILCGSCSAGLMGLRDKNMSRREKLGMLRR